MSRATGPGKDCEASFARGLEGLRSYVELSTEDLDLS
jgi:hypothetical protein